MRKTKNGEKFQTGDADGFLIVFSVNDLKSFEEAQEFREQIVKIRQDETIPFILVGNKVDLEERQVKVGQALAKATDWNVWYMETSAKTRRNVCKVFINVMNKMIEKQRIQAIPVDDKEEEEDSEALLSKKKTWVFNFLTKRCAIL